MKCSYEQCYSLSRDLPRGSLSESFTEVMTINSGWGVERSNIAMADGWQQPHNHECPHGSLYFISTVVPEIALALMDYDKEAA
jgi:hypothetical protein